MVAESNTATPDEPRKSQAMQDFEALIERLANEATAADREKIAELVNPDGTVRIDELTPAQASVLYKDHQGHNRDFSLPKANYYAGAMKRTTPGAGNTLPLVVGRWYNFHEFGVDLGIFGQ